MTTRDRFLAAAGVSAAVFMLYLLTLSPSAAMWDAGEYIAAAKSLGIPHQPGNPLFVLIAHVAGMIPISPDYAVRINVLAALSGAVTAGLWFLCAERLLRASIEHTRSRVVASAVAALLGATAFTVWNQSVVMEKVYPLALVCLALVSWLLLRWIDETNPRRSDRLLTLMAYLVGLGYAIHPAGLLTAPALAVAVLRHKPGTLVRVRLLGIMAAMAVFGASSFAILPIRAAYQPFINESAVSACEDGKLEASCTFSRETARRLVGTIQREQYGGNPVLVRRAPFSAQVQMYWLYFKWQWLRDATGQMPLWQALVAASMLVLGFFGIASLRRAHEDESRQAPQFWYFATLTATFTVVLVYYLNFRYGWSQAQHLGDTVPREPRDRDYFYMWTFSLWGLLAGIGLASLVHNLPFGADRDSKAARAKPSSSPNPWLSVALIAIALLPLAANFKDASRRGQSFTREWAADMLNTVEPNGVLITNGDNDSFPLWYAQEVEGIRRDVTVALTPYLDMEWYARQLNNRSHIWKLTSEELDTIPPYQELARPTRFTHGSIAATIPAGFITRGQLLVLRAIKDSFPSRAIYFAPGSYAPALGLAPYIRRVGLLDKLEAAEVKEGPDTVRFREGFMDLTRSLALWKTYGGARQLARQGKWVDGASGGVPLLYAVVGQDIAIALEARGDSAQAQQVIELARKAAEVTR